MTLAAATGTTTADGVPVIDFRRHGMFLLWHESRGTWSASDVPPARVHGIALIRASGPNLCLFGSGGRLQLQVGAERYPVTGDSLRVRCRPVLASLGLRRRFTVEEGSRMVYGHSYWTGQGDDFFRWVASRTSNIAWAESHGALWSEGVDASEVRSS